MKQNRNKLYILGIIIFLAALLRFWGLGSNPPSLTWDEAAWGYNAYSIGIDGKDEFGRFLPLNYLESFGDYKPPMYAYLDVIPIKVFGLNEFGVRFPSALFGVLTVLLTFFLTKRIFINSKHKEQYALFSSLFLAISPWHIMLSRAAFEANVATFYIVFGIFLFLKAVQSNKWFLVLSAVSFTFSFYTFNTSRIVSPLLAILLFVIFRKILIKNKREILVSLVVAVLMFLPSVKFFLSPQSRLRFQEVNIFSDPSIVSQANSEASNDNNTFLSKIIHNRRFIYSVDYLKHYFDNLSPSFLFVKGDGNPKFSTQDVGELYLWDLPFFIGGLIFIFKKKEGAWFLIPLWLLIGIIPAATARETPHALRIETTIPTFQILIAYGFVQVLNRFKSKKFLIISLVFLFINFAYFLHGYYSHYAREFSGEWQYGYKDSISYVSKVQGKYDQINVTKELGRPYIYYLFYLQKKPDDFRKSAIVKREALGFVNVVGFDKYRFGKDLGKINSPSNSLYIDIPNRIPSKANILKTFKLLNGNPALIAYTL